MKEKNKKKRLGRGYGSGKGGHTSSRGQKGQKSRGSINILFEGVKVKKSLLRRLPVQRGKLKNKPHQKPIIVKLEKLNSFPANSTITVDALIKAGIVNKKAKKLGIKVLGTGKLEKKLKLNVPTSKTAIKIQDKKDKKISDAK